MQMVRDLLLWMDEVKREMTSHDRPRDVSGVELLMNNHQSLKAEIDAREENFHACINLGRKLLERRHYASTEIEKKLIKLTTERANMLESYAIFYFVVDSHNCGCRCFECVFFEFGFPENVFYCSFQTND